MRFFKIFLTFVSMVFLSVEARADNKSYSETIAGFEKRSGYFDLFVNSNDNQVLALLPAPSQNSDVLLSSIYTMRLRAGLGSNPVGLDRGWGTRGVIINFRKFGKKIIIEQENLTYRADPQNPLEALAVDESFADSFLASLDVMATAPSGELLVDLTEFLERDGLGLAAHLKARGQGSFSRSKELSFVDTKSSLTFPDNVEIDSYITLTSTKAGSEVATTAANGQDATLIQHHSFVRLPKPGFTPVQSDPRMGAIELVYMDYSAPLAGPVEKRLAIRHRLEKDATGKTINPIIFYIDSGAPEPVRSALVEGALWWKDAFAAAGYPDGYEVRLLPEDVHPLDVRYNVVQWVHRQTRGWSYGGGVVDPRTGEFLKGHVNLGSLRVRQDRMIFEGLAGTSKTGTGSDDDPIELALDRIRQLSAHEIGHSLGFAHNFAASSYNKGSVMDYPAPDVKVRDGQLDFSQAYGVGIGPWDKFAAKMLYGDLSAAEREAAYQDASARGLLYVADSDGRGIGTGHPHGAIWDNEADPVVGLQEVLEVREFALENFGPDRIHDGQPQSDLNKVIVPIYLYHRYQTAAAGKYLGGMNFDYAVTGEGQSPVTFVSKDDQERALAVILETLKPSFLDMNDDTLGLLTPALNSWTFIDSDRELFKKTAYPTFDLISAADTSASLTFDVLLNETRAARMVEMKRRDQNQLGFADLLSAVKAQVMARPRDLTSRQEKLHEAVQRRFAYSLMDLIESDSSTVAVKAIAEQTLRNVRAQFGRNSNAHGRFMTAEIERFMKRPAETSSVIVDEKRLPPGSPIGQSESCWFCSE